MKINLIYYVFIFLFLILFTKIYWIKNSPPFGLYRLCYNCILKYKTKYTSLNKKVCYENISILHDVLTKHNIFFWLSEGTALGFRRNNDFISHDDDVDISIYEKDLDKFLDIIPELQKHGFNYNGKCHNMPYFLSRKGMIIDVDVVGDNLYCTANYSPCKELKPYVQKFNKIKIRGKIFNIPTDKYFRKLYGDTWRISIRGKKPNKN
jgi:hypothetical protein